MDGGAWWATVHGVAKSRTRLSDLLTLYGARFLCPRDSPGKNIGVGCCVLLQGIFLQGIFLTQGWNQGLHCRQILQSATREAPVTPSQDLYQIATLMLVDSEQDQVFGANELTGLRKESPKTSK